MARAPDAGGVQPASGVSRHRRPRAACVAGLPAHPHQAAPAAAHAQYCRVDVWRVALRGNRRRASHDADVRPWRGPHRVGQGGVNPLPQARVHDPVCGLPAAARRNC
ncbi:hypothetical protein G6F55_014400 [Rhizopus delemar]|nr:hypothetical protein G6F55_014400 [Rhizopus delemar]